MACLRCSGTVLLLVALSGCGGCGDDDGGLDGGGPPPGDAGDAGSRDGEGGMDGDVIDGPRVELGTSARDFVPVNDGDTLLLARGCQGGQHVWISLRIHGLNPRSAVVQLQMLRLVDGEPIACDAAMPGAVCRPLESCNGICQNAYPFQVRTTFDVATGTDYGQISGLTLQTPDPDGLLETDVRIRARVTDRDMLSAETERDVRVIWGTETCGSKGSDGGDGEIVFGDGAVIPMDPPDAG